MWPQGRQFKKWNDIRKALGRDRWVHTPWNQKNCQKSQPELPLKMVWWGKKAPTKTLSKKWLFGAFYQEWEKREMIKTMSECLRVCVCEQCCQLDFSGSVNNSWEGKQNRDVWLGESRHSRTRGEGQTQAETRQKIEEEKKKNVDIKMGKK